MHAASQSCCGLLVVLCLLNAAGTAAANTVLCDNSHGQPVPLITDARFSLARAAITGAGHSLAQLSGSPGAITSAALAGYDVFYTGTLNQSFTAAEITVLQSFVSAGGGVIVAHDGGFSSDSATPSVNTFLQPYGMQLALVSTYPSGVVVSGFDHCLTANVNTLGMDYVRELTAVTPPAEDLTTGSIQVLALYEAAGWVIFIADESMWTNPGTGADYDLDDFDNQTMLLNAFGYSTGCGVIQVEPATWSSVKSLYRDAIR